MQKNNYKNNNNKNNHRNQVFDSNGPTGRIKGNAKSISDKYMSMARDAYASGDYILMETLYQHAEHYFRINNYLNDQAEQKRKNRADREEKIELETTGSENVEEDTIEVLTDLSADTEITNDELSFTDEDSPEEGDSEKFNKNSSYKK